jgi:hypothetical protein
VPASAPDGAGRLLSALITAGDEVARGVGPFDVDGCAHYAGTSSFCAIASV